MKRNSRYSSQCGLTLVELMVTLLILAVLATLGAPALSRSLTNYRQRAAVQSLIAAFQLARGEAVTRRQGVTLCPRATEPYQCGPDYAQGWQVFVDREGDRLPGSGDEPIQHFAPVSEGLFVTNRAGTHVAFEPITWYPDGSAHRNLTLQVCSSHGEKVQSLGVVLNRVGRPRVARGEGVCPSEAF